MLLIVSLAVIINNYDEGDNGVAEDLRNRFTVTVAGDVGEATNTSIYIQISNPRVVCDLCTFDQKLSNEYSTHLPESEDSQ